MKNTNPSDELAEIIKQAKSGDSKAISVLYESFVDRIYRYIAYRVADEDAEDVTADVFTRMVEALPQYVYAGVPFEAWLYRIAAARVADHHRKRARRKQEQISESLSDQEPLPEENLEQEQELHLIRSALQHLSSEEQTVLLLRFVEQMSHKQVADVIGKSVPAVRTMQHRALTRLAQLMEASTKARHYLRGMLTPSKDDDPSTVS
jgi:RNA polymerase sigma-70 factor, ECF subfamily